MQRVAPCERSLSFLTVLFAYVLFFHDLLSLSFLINFLNIMNDIQNDGISNFIAISVCSKPALRSHPEGYLEKILS